MTLVKICGLTRLSDAELALRLGADALGFVMDPASVRYIGNDPDALSIPDALGPYALCVAVFGRAGETPRGFHLTQFVDGEPSDGRPSLPVFRPRAGDTAESLLQRIDRHPAVLLDAYSAKEYGGTGHKVDWDLAAEIVERACARVILAGGLTPENVREAIERVHPYAVDVSGGVEFEPRVKDPDKLARFIEAAKEV